MDFTLPIPFNNIVRYIDVKSIVCIVVLLLVIILSLGGSIKAFYNCISCSSYNMVKILLTLYFNSLTLFHHKGCIYFKFHP